MNRRNAFQTVTASRRWWIPALLVLAAIGLLAGPLRADEEEAAEPAAETEPEAAGDEEREAVETAMIAPVEEEGESARREALIEALPEPEPITFRPPLSLNECLRLIDQIIEILPGEGADSASLANLPAASILRMIDSCYGYLNIRDDLHTSLAHYQWMRIGETRVADPGDENDRDVLFFDTPVHNISALSLHVDRGDVLLHGMWVYDEEGMERQQFYFNPPKRLRHSLPRMEVFHLWTRTQISRIEIEYTRAEEMNRSPKVFISGGVTNRREYIKTALYNLKKEAEPAILQGRFAEARSHLEDARLNILEFSRLNREIE